MSTLLAVILGVSSSGLYAAQASLTLSLTLETAQAVSLSVEETDDPDTVIVRVEAVRTGWGAMHERRSFLVEGGPVVFAVYDTITPEHTGSVAVRELGAEGERLVLK